VIDPCKEMGPVGVDIGCGLVHDFGDHRLGMCVQAPLILWAVEACTNEAHHLNQGGMVAVFSGVTICKPKFLSWCVLLVEHLCGLIFRTEF